MNQKDWITEQDRIISGLEQELWDVEARLKLYGDVTYRIAQIDRDVSQIAKDEHKRQLELAGIVSHDPRRYHAGNSRLVKSDIMTRLMSEYPGIDQHTVQELGVDLCWKQYHEVRDRDFMLMELKAKTNYLWALKKAIRETQPEEYMELLNKKAELESTIQWHNNRLDNYRDITAFRQFAKEQKQRDLDEVVKKRKEVLKGEVATWVSDNVWAQSGM